MLGGPSVGAVFAALHGFKGAVHLVKCAGRSVAHFVVASSFQHTGGTNLGEVQKDGVQVAVPDRRALAGCAVVKDYIYVVVSAIGIEIR